MEHSWSLPFFLLKNGFAQYLRLTYANQMLLKIDILPNFSHIVYFISINLKDHVEDATLLADYNGSQVSLHLRLTR